METTYNKLSQKIFSITEDIQQNFPWLYKVLDETPIDLKVYKETSIKKTDLKLYLEELISQMGSYQKTNNKIKKSLNIK